MRHKIRKYGNIGNLRNMEKKYRNLGNIDDYSGVCLPIDGMG